MSKHERDSDEMFLRIFRKAYSDHPGLVEKMEKDIRSGKFSSKANKDLSSGDLHHTGEFGTPSSLIKALGYQLWPEMPLSAQAVGYFLDLLNLDYQPPFPSEATQPELPPPLPPEATQPLNQVDQDIFGPPEEDTLGYVPDNFNEILEDPTVSTDINVDQNMIEAAGHGSLSDVDDITVQNQGIQVVTNGHQDPEVAEMEREIEIEQDRNLAVSVEAAEEFMVRAPHENSDPSIIAEDALLNAELREGFDVSVHYANGDTPPEPEPHADPDPEIIGQVEFAPVVRPKPTPKQQPAPEPEDPAQTNGHIEKHDLDTKWQQSSPTPVDWPEVPVPESESVEVEFTPPVSQSGLNAPSPNGWEEVPLDGSEHEYTYAGEKVTVDGKGKIFLPAGVTLDSHDMVVHQNNNTVLEIPLHVSNRPTDPGVYSGGTRRKGGQFTRTTKPDLRIAPGDSQDLMNYKRLSVTFAKLAEFNLPIYENLSDLAQFKRISAAFAPLGDLFALAEQYTAEQAAAEETSAPAEATSPTGVASQLEEIIAEPITPPTYQTSSEVAEETEQLSLYQRAKQKVVFLWHKLRGTEADHSVAKTEEEVEQRYAELTGEMGHNHKIVYGAVAAAALAGVIAIATVPECDTSTEHPTQLSASAAPAFPKVVHLVGLDSQKDLEDKVAQAAPTPKKVTKVDPKQTKNVLPAQTSPAGYLELSGKQIKESNADRGHWEDGIYKEAASYEKALRVVQDSNGDITDIFIDSFEDHKMIVYDLGLISNYTKIVVKSDGKTYVLDLAKDGHIVKNEHTKKVLAQANASATPNKDRIKWSKVAEEEDHFKQFNFASVAKGTSGYASLEDNLDQKLAQENNEQEPAQQSEDPTSIEKLVDSYNQMNSFYTEQGIPAPKFSDYLKSVAQTYAEKGEWGVLADYAIFDGTKAENQAKLTAALKLATDQGLQLKRFHRQLADPDLADIAKQMYDKGKALKKELFEEFRDRVKEQYKMDVSYSTFKRLIKEKS